MSDTLDHIDHYFNEELTPTEKEAFEKRCLADPDFAKKVAFYIMVNDHLKEQWSERKRSEFAEFEQVDPSIDTISGKSLPNGAYGEEKNEQKDEEQERLIGDNEIPREEPSISSKIKAWKIPAVAAAILGTVVLSITWYINNTINQNKADVTINKNIPDTTSTQQNTPLKSVTEKDKPSKEAINEEKYRITDAKRDVLFAANFKPDIVPEDKPGSLQDAFVHYQSGDYKGAIASINENVDLVFRDDEHEDEERTAFYAYYYLAQSYMADNNSAKAIPEFRKAFTKSLNEFSKSKVQWYLALAYLKTGKLKKSEELLKQLADDNNKNNKAKEYRQKAAKLISQLKS